MAKKKELRDEITAQEEINEVDSLSTMRMREKEKRGSSHDKKEDLH